MTKLASKIRHKVNKGLHGLPTYHDSPGLALAAVGEVLETEGLWFGMVWVPKTGTVRVTVMTGKPDTSEEREVSNSLLIVQTHEMPSGRVELTSYLS